jgi:hypothetical protein
LRITRNFSRSGGCIPGAHESEGDGTATTAAEVLHNDRAVMRHIRQPLSVELIGETNELLSIFNRSILTAKTALRK